MKQLIRFLFLSLSIVFSFGFTVSTSACQNQKTEVHSCCQKSKKETAPKECDGDCCFQTTSISRFEELESVVESKKVLPVISLNQKEEQHFNSSINDTKLVALSFYEKPFIDRPCFLLSKTQSWLI